MKSLKVCWCYRQHRCISSLCLRFSSPYIWLFPGCALAGPAGISHVSLLHRRIDAYLFLESVFCVSGRISCCVFSCFVKLVFEKWYQIWKCQFRVLSISRLLRFKAFVKLVSNWFLAARAQVRRRPWIRKPFYISRLVYLHESTRRKRDSTTISRKTSKNKKTAFAWHFDDCEIWDHVRSIGTVGIAGRWICRSAFLIPWALFRSWVRCNISYCDFYFVQCHQDKFMFFWYSIHNSWWKRKTKRQCRSSLFIKVFGQTCSSIFLRQSLR